MTKKAFNPGDWKKPRKKEILRCAQDDSTDGQASNDENLTDENVMTIENAFVLVDKFHLADARKQLSLSHRLKVTIVFHQRATSRHSSRRNKNHLVTSLVKFGYFGH